MINFKQKILYLLSKLLALKPEAIYKNCRHVIHHSRNDYSRKSRYHFSLD